ncbi:hypothetical protein B566_EDAN017183 [Ephemera danica]|nr:hypothetical protein B566_EDAN017183 [Ephemera danica]
MHTIPQIGAYIQCSHTNGQNDKKQKNIYIHIKNMKLAVYGVILTIPSFPQRMDLGECPKIHDLALRADYEQASHAKDYYYDIDAMEHLQAFIADCDRRTELAKQRLAETQEELSAEVAAKANKVHELAEQIGKKLAKAEQLGAEGFVEESMKLMEEVEDLRKKKLAAEQEYRNSMPASSYQQQKLRVCEVCSAYLGIHDNDRRLADHFGGKLHLGFIKIREKLTELTVNLTVNFVSFLNTFVTFSYFVCIRCAITDEFSQATMEERKQKKREEKEKEREERERANAAGSMGDGMRGRSRDNDRPARHSRRSPSRERSRGHRRSSRSRSRSRSKSRSSRGPAVEAVVQVTAAPVPRTTGVVRTPGSVVGTGETGTGKFLCCSC